MWVRKNLAIWRRRKNIIRMSGFQAFHLVRDGTVCADDDRLNESRMLGRQKMLRQIISAGLTVGMYQLLCSLAT
jgi:hypothetical protein